MGNKADKNNTTPAPLTGREIKILKNSTGMDEERIRKIYNDFMHDCPSGRMNKDQFTKISREVSNNDAKFEKTIDHRFATFDQNGDGTIDFREFVLGVSLLNKTDLDSKLELAFEMIDTSSDGKISFMEMIEFTRTLLSLTNDPKIKDEDPQKHATEIYQALGFDTNQRLTKQQFIEGCKKNDHLKKIFMG